MKKLIFVACLLSMTSAELKADQCSAEAAQVCEAPTAQEFCPTDCSAFCDGEKASYMAALLPLGALAVAAIIIATSDNGGHNYSSRSSSCSHYSHSR